jgi:hypothetical protein
MDALAEKLDTKHRLRKPETAARVRERVIEVIEFAEEDVLDVMGSRARDRKVLDLSDERPRTQSRGLQILAWLTLGETCEAAAIWD